MRTQLAQKFVCSIILLWFCCVSLILCDQESGESKKPYNLLWIMFDDLRPELSVYGREHMITPNFERLAAKSVVFDYSFCQVAVCNPSRDSLMTGLRPDTVGTYNFAHSYWPHMPLPMHLVREGYNTAGIGKIFHWETTDRNVWSFDAWDNNWYTPTSFHHFLISLCLIFFFFSLFLFSSF
jgi:arylsulfatase A-like enzyme